MGQQAAPFARLLVSQSRTSLRDLIPPVPAVPSRPTGRWPPARAPPPTRRSRARSPAGRQPPSRGSTTHPAFVRTGHSHLPQSLSQCDRPAPLVRALGPRPHDPQSLSRCRTTHPPRAPQQPIRTRQRNARHSLTSAAASPGPPSHGLHSGDGADVKGGALAESAEPTRAKGAPLTAGPAPRPSNDEGGHPRTPQTLGKSVGDPANPAHPSRSALRGEPRAGRSIVLRGQGGPGGGGEVGVGAARGIGGTRGCARGAGGGLDTRVTIRTTAVGALKPRPVRRRPRQQVSPG